VSRALQAISTAYVAALGFAIAVACAVPYEHPIAIVFAADVAATCAVFAFSFAFRNSSFYDPYWSVAPPVIAAWWWIGSEGSGGGDARRWLVLALVTIWAVRLTYNWARGWTGLDHEDWRYVDIQDKAGRAYWAVSFVGIHMLPTLWVFVGCLPLYVVMAEGVRPLGWLDGVAAFVTAGMIWIEARADKELFEFKGSERNRGQTLDTGLRRYARHPNYLGEMGFWWGLFLFGLAANPAWWWTILGAASITLMFRFVSLPMIEGRMSANRPDYAAYAARTSAVLPWPPRPDRKAEDGIGR